MEKVAKEVFFGQIRDDSTMDACYKISYPGYLIKQFSTFTGFKCHVFTI